MTSSSTLRPLLLLTGGAIALAAFRIGQTRARTALSQDGAERPIRIFDFEGGIDVDLLSKPDRSSALSALKSWMRTAGQKPKASDAPCPSPDPGGLHHLQGMSATGATLGAEPGSPPTNDPGPLTQLADALNRIVAMKVEAVTSPPRIGTANHPPSEYWNLVGKLLPIVTSLSPDEWGVWPVTPAARSHGR